MSDAGRQHTYADLRAQAASLAGRLRDAGLRSGSPVGLMAPNGMFWASAYLAALSLGLPVVPISTTLTREEVQGRVRFVGAHAVLLGRREERAMAGDLPPGVVPVAESAPGDAAAPPD